jgi:hypothetical protein
MPFIRMCHFTTDFDETWSNYQKEKDLDFEWLSRPNIKTEIHAHML